MPLERFEDNYTRLNYFDGLFLQVPDFEVQRDFHVDVAHYLNYLLFDEGRLFEDDTVIPLEINVTAHIVDVSRGSAMVRHPLEPRAFELHMDSPVSFDMDDPALTRGDGTPLLDGDALTLTIEPARRTTRVGTASLVPDDDRLIERAVIVLRAPLDPPPTGPHHVLANLVHRTGAVPTEFTETTDRGGIRYEMFSGPTRAKLGGPVGGATLVTINVIPSTLTLNVGANQGLAANGNFSDGSSRPLTAADGLSWSADNIAIATVDAAGVVTGVSLGSTTIRADTGGTIEGTATVSVVSAVSPLIVSANPPAFIGARVGDTVILEGTQIRAAGTVGGQATGTSVTITSGVTLTVPDTAITAETDSLAGRQRISFSMPLRDGSWGANQAVVLRVSFGGGTTPDPGFSYKYRS